MRHTANYEKDWEGAIGSGIAAYQEFCRCSLTVSVRKTGNILSAFCEDTLLGDGWFAMCPGLDKNGKSTHYVFGPYRTRAAAIAAAI